MAREKQPTRPVPQMTIAEWEAAFPTDDACKLYLAEHRWPEFVVCPRCGNAEVKPHGPELQLALLRVRRGQRRLPVLGSGQHDLREHE